MKKFWLLLLVATFALVANAQSIKSGSIDCLQGQTKVALVIDYSNATILGMSEGVYAKYEQNWELCKKEALVNFVTHFNEKNENVMFVGNDAADYVFNVNVLSINKKGHCKAELNINDAKTNETIAVIATFDISKFSVGTTNHKVKSNIGSLGEKIGEFITKGVN